MNTAQCRCRGLAFLRSPRVWLGLLVTVIWLGVMSFIVIREAQRQGNGLRRLGLSPELMLVTWRDYDQWMWVENQGRRIGASHLSIVRRTEQGEQQGYHMNSRWRLTFQVPIDMEVRVAMDDAFTLETFQGLIRLAGQTFELQGFVEDMRLYYRLQVKSGALAGLTLIPPRDVCGWVPLQGEVVLSEVVAPLVMQKENLQVGEKWTVSASNLMNGVMDQPIVVEVEALEELELDGKTQNAWRLSERMGQIESHVWYDTDGRMLKRSVPQGMSWVQAVPKDVLQSDPAFRKRLDMQELDKDWIRQHLAPEWSGKSLEQLLPPMPSL